MAPGSLRRVHGHVGADAVGYIERADLAIPKAPLNTHSEIEIQPPPPCQNGHSTESPPIASTSHKAREQTVATDASLTEAARILHSILKSGPVTGAPRLSEGAGSARSPMNRPRLSQARTDRLR